MNIMSAIQSVAGTNPKMKGILMEAAQIASGMAKLNNWRQELIKFGNQHNVKISNALQFLQQNAPIRGIVDKMLPGFLDKAVPFVQNMAQEQESGSPQIQSVTKGEGYRILPLKPKR